MSAMASQITSVSIVYWTVCSGGDQRQHHCEGNSPVIGEFPAQMAINAENISIDDVIMVLTWEMCNIEITKGCPDQLATMYLSKYLLFICTL